MIKLLFFQDYYLYNIKNNLTIKEIFVFFIKKNSKKF